MYDFFTFVNGEEAALSGSGSDLRAIISAADLESTPLMRALRDGSVSRVAYVGFLRLLAAVHATLNRTLCLLDEAQEAVGESWSSKPGDLLLQDLAQFRDALVPDVMAAARIGPRIAQQIMTTAGSNPEALHGHIAVLDHVGRETYAVDRICAALGLSEESGAAFLAHGRQAGNGSPDPQIAANDAVLDAARSLLASFTTAFRALEPADPEGFGFHVTGLNPEGGVHPITQDPEELRVVLAATDRCLARYPYFLQRYGARGRRFTDSDGAWLVFLADANEATRLRRIDWLAQLLSARGLPSILLKIHLEILVEELERALPDRRGRYSALVSEAERLGRRFERCLATSTAEGLIGDFAQALGRARTDETARDLGLLCVSAVADEAIGIRNSVMSVFSWIADSGCYSREWIIAAADLISNARSAVRERAGVEA